MRLQSFKSLYCMVLLFASITHTTSAFTTRKFTQWFPQFREALSPSWIDGPCKSLYDGFVDKHEGECGLVLNCLLENTTELRKTTIASAQVVLGVTPPLLASLGSTVVETSLVTSQHFTLSLLLAIGAPAVYQVRISDFISVADTLQALPRGFTRPSSTSRITYVASLIGQYVVAVAAAANTMELVLRVGSRSVLAWACGSWYLPMMWVLFSVAIFTAAAFSLMVFGPQDPKQDFVKGSERATVTSMTTREAHQPQRWLDPGHNRLMNPRMEPSRSCVLLQALAKFLAFVHILLGTFIFSSLIFIGFHDTLVILARLTAAALVCRAITLYQLMSLEACRVNEVERAR